MSLKCPLCFKRLGPEDTLHRHCFRCGLLAPVKAGQLDGKSFPLLCRGTPECRGDVSIHSGVYVLHEGCPRLNPFWDGTRVSVPVKASFADADGKNVPVDHELIVRLRMAATGAGGNLAEMWFPYELFAAVNEYVGTHRLGTTIMLSGAMNVGKSTVSTVCLNPRTLAAAEQDAGTRPPGRLMVIDDFTYVAPPEGLTAIALPEDGTAGAAPAAGGGARRYTKFLQYLLANVLIRGNRTAREWTQATPSDEHNLRVAFCRGDETGGAAGGNEKFGVWLRKSAGTLFGLSQSANSGAPLASSAVLAFWDTPGEDSERPLHPSLVKLADKMDVVAYFVDVNQLSRFGCRDFRGILGMPATNAAGDSVDVAYRRMTTAARRVRRCIVVTKLDQVRAAMSEDELEVVGRQEREERPWEANARELLLDWLGMRTARDAEAKLATLVREKDIPVFFVSVEGLPGAAPPSPPAGSEAPASVGGAAATVPPADALTPYGRGFMPFVNWCLHRKVVK